MVYLLIKSKYHLVFAIKKRPCRWGLGLERPQAFVKTIVVLVYYGSHFHHLLMLTCNSCLFDYISFITEYDFSPSSLNEDNKVTTYHRIVEAFKFAYAKRSALGDDRHNADITEVRWQLRCKILYTINPRPSSTAFRTSLQSPGKFCVAKCLFFQYKVVYQSIYLGRKWLFKQKLCFSYLRNYGIIKAAS